MNDNFNKEQFRKLLERQEEEREERQRRDRSRRRLEMIEGLTHGIFMVVGVLAYGAFWALIAYVIIHFVSKFW